MYSGIFEFNVRDSVLALIAGQFAAMLRAGILLPEAVKIIARGTADKRMRRILTACAQALSFGDSFSKAITRQGGIPRLFAQAVRAGEENGRLTEVFDYLRAYYESRSSVRRRIRTAILYPVFLLLLASAVVWVVMIYLMPAITTLLTASGVALPLSARILIASSAFFSKKWPIAVFGIVVLLISRKLLSRTRQGAVFLSKIRLHLPVIGRIATLSTAGQFANVVATLISAGLPLTKVLRITGKVVDNRAVGQSITDAAVRLEAGEGLGEALEHCKNLPRMIRAMAATGEASGTLAQTMAAAGSYFDAEAMASADQALSMLEPMLTVLIGLFVAFVMISIFVPLLTVYGTIGL